MINLYAQWRNLKFYQLKKDPESGTYLLPIDSSFQQANIITFHSGTFTGQNGTLTTTNHQKIPLSEIAISLGDHYEIDTLHPPIPAATYVIDTGGDRQALVYALVESTRTLQLLQPTSTTRAYAGLPLTIQVQLFDQGKGPVIPATGEEKIVFATVIETIDGKQLSQTVNLQQVPGRSIFTGQFSVSSHAKSGDNIKVSVFSQYQGVSHTTAPRVILVALPAPSPQFLCCNISPSLLTYAIAIFIILICLIILIMLVAFVLQSNNAALPLKKLLEDGEAWNQWRQRHPSRSLSMRNIDLSERYLSGVDLSGATLANANLSGANFNGAILKNADLTQATLLRTDLSGADLASAILSGANLSEATLRETDFKGADLSEVNLYKATLAETKLADTNLRGANFAGVEIDRAQFASVDLVGATFEGASMYGAVFKNTDLSKTKKLESVNHSGPSTIDDDTKARSHGNIPVAFLRGVGLSDEQIASVRDLFEKHAGYYSCFISYSSKNQDFAETLHNYLQENGVRCWYAPKDMKPGDRIQHDIRESVRRHDKLLLILSEDSIKSAWVKEEAEWAIEKEIRDRQEVLFPITIDHAIKNTSEQWVITIRLERHIGDFTNWKYENIYQRALDQLLHNLKK